MSQAWEEHEDGSIQLGKLRGFIWQSIEIQTFNSRLKCTVLYDTSKTMFCTQVGDELNQ